ncbi:thrombospondin type-1 domain-containing protein 4-like isoform X2 [Apostichopus japonicus]|uniref:thrombospondin type-1 domain-containing protein 4-like isoform X2 n=1 Tax=Stichopus japonicus TaxID=307972 RepID=UPI003AB5866A
MEKRTMEVKTTKKSFLIAAVLISIFVVILPSTTSALSGTQTGGGLRAHWSQWSSWSSCSRSCGGGVAEQTRTCLRRRRGRAKSMHTSNHCVGLYKRYKMCNKKNCPEGSRPFREEQCDMYNTMPLMDILYTWEALIQETKPCELHCRAQGQTFFAKLADKVIDGTPCRNNSDIDVCVDGMCKRVGCDGVLGSGLELDKCGVCGGSNTACEITRETFDKNDLSVGYHIIATVPEGAMYINMTEMSRSRNYLALQGTNGKPYINGAWHIDYPGNFTVAGTVFQYQRPRTEGGEVITAMGPTTEPVDIMMIYQQANPGIYYEYTIPLHKPSDVRGVGGDFVTDQEYDYSSYSYYEEGEVGLPDVADRNTGTFTANLPASTNPRVPPPSSNSRNPVQPGGAGYPSRYPAIGGQGRPQGPGQNPQGRPGSVVPIYEAVDTSSSSGVPGQFPHGKPGTSGPRYPPQGKPIYTLPIADTPQNPLLHNVPQDPTGSRGNPQYPPTVRESFPPNGPNRHETQDKNQALGQVAGGTYNLPEESSNADDGEANHVMYYWMDSEMTECSRSCAGGIQQSMSHCVDTIYLSPVDDDMCIQDWKPAAKIMACNTQPCPPTWTAGEWTECSATCGSSSRLRQVLCKEQRTQSVITTVPVTNCNQTSRPASAEQCQVPSCPSWETGEWGECSVDCGTGQQQRRVTCQQDGTEVSDRHCADQTKPSEREECDMGSCIPEWLYSLYTESCSSECGSGYKSRNVICSTAGSAGAVSQDNCAGMVKPRVSKVCNRASCGAKWVMSEWSQCSSECGPGSQSRLVLCVTYRDGNTIVQDSQCRDDKPVENQECNVRECGSSWYTADFTQCSRSCGGGVMTRTVKCLNEAFEPSSECIGDRPSDLENCNPQECVDNAPPTNCRDKFSYCNKVARSRLCNYSYYSRLCCYSCYNQVNR